MSWMVVAVGKEGKIRNARVENTRNSTSTLKEKEEKEREEQKERIGKNLHLLAPRSKNVQ